MAKFKSVSPPIDGYFAYVKRPDPLAAKVDGEEGEPLGTCLDASRGLEPLGEKERAFVDEMRALIGGEEGAVAVAELECILRKTLYDFSLAQTHTIMLIRRKARERGIDLPSL